MLGTNQTESKTPPITAPKQAGVLAFFLSADDPLSMHREKAMLPISIVCCIGLIPILFLNLSTGIPLLYGVIICILLIFIINIGSLIKYNKPILPFELLLIPMCGGVYYSMSIHGALGLFWAFPAATIAHFLSSKRVAGFVCCFLLFAMTSFALLLLTPAAAMRFFVTFGLTIVLINIILNIVQQLQMQMLQQSLLDPLTGAFNRRKMDLELELLICNRLSQGELNADCICLLDIDNFKEINDQYGHDCGDLVLIRLVQFFLAESKVSHTFYRIGGEEFLILLQHTSSVEAIAELKRLQQLLAQRELVPDTNVTFSAGISQGQLSADLPIERLKSNWLKRADQALYQVKRQGKNAVLAADLPSADTIEAGAV